MDFLSNKTRRIALSAGLCLAVLAGVTATTVRPAAAALGSYVCNGDPGREAGSTAEFKL